MAKIILAFTGQIASGKGTAVAYLKEKYDASTYRFSSILSDILNRLYLDNSRENFQSLSQILRKNFSEDILSKTLAEDVKKDKNKIIAIDGVRRPGDVKHLQALPGFVLIHIFADLKIRYIRITGRKEKTDDKEKTLAEFKADHQREAELKIAEIASQASETINNNGNLDELYKQLDDLIHRFTNDADLQIH